jgi:hypothetical protein
MKKDSFTEVQTIDAIWPLTILSLTFIFNWVLYFKMGHTDIQFFYGSVISAAFLSIFLSIIKLSTSIDNEGIHFKFRPFHLKWNTILWSEIKKWEVREYHPISEYGGWGLRLGKSGKAYTIKGKLGLQLLLVSGKKILIGTNQKESVQKIITELSVK